MASAWHTVGGFAGQPITVRQLVHRDGCVVQLGFPLPPHCGPALHNGCGSRGLTCLFSPYTCHTLLMPRLLHLHLPEPGPSQVPPRHTLRFNTYFVLQQNEAQSPACSVTELSSCAVHSMACDFLHYSLRLSFLPSVHHLYTPLLWVPASLSCALDGGYWPQFHWAISHQFHVC